MRGMSTLARTLGLISGILLLLPACSVSQSSKGTVELAFQGRCVTSNGQGIPAFSLLVDRTPSDTAAAAKTVTTTSNGQYEIRVPFSGAATPAGSLLGDRAQKVTIKVSASGYKTKSFVVTADQLFIGKVNNLNITLEPLATAS